MDRDPGLMDPDEWLMEELDLKSFTPLSSEITSRQPTINIGIIGHKAHGKSSVVTAISGVQMEVNAKLAFANAKIFKCENDRCPRPMCYKYCGGGYQESPVCDICQNPRMKLLRHVSFVEFPAYGTLMSSEVNGAAIIDGALLVIAGNESCPQTQTLEHLTVAEANGIEHIIILQNKMDLIQKSQATWNGEQIQDFIEGTIARGAPVVPISATLNANMDVVCEYIAKRIPIPIRDYTSAPTMIIMRSFNGNKAWSEVDTVQGGVVDGNIIKGVLTLNKFIEVRPGIVGVDERGKHKYTPIFSRIVSLYAEQNELQFAVPGGLIGAGTTMDPELTCDDKLAGHVLGAIGSLPDVFVELDVNFSLLKSLLVGFTNGTETWMDVDSMSRGEYIMINVGLRSTGSRVAGVRNGTVKLRLLGPVCTTIGQKVFMSRRVTEHGPWRMVGWGDIKAGVIIAPSET